MKARGLALDAGEFKEGDHPRAENGQFGKGGGGNQGGRERLIKQIEKDLRTPGMHNDRNDRRKDQRELARLKSGKQKTASGASNPNLQRKSQQQYTEMMNKRFGGHNPFSPEGIAAASKGPAQPKQPKLYTRMSLERMTPNQLRSAYKEAHAYMHGGRKPGAIPASFTKAQLVDMVARSHEAIAESNDREREEYRDKNQGSVRSLFKSRKRGDSALTAHGKGR